MMEKGPIDREHKDGLIRYWMEWGLNKSVDNSTFELIVMGYAKISPIRRLPVRVRTQTGSRCSAPRYYTRH